MPVVDAQKHVGGGKGETRVSVHERMVDAEPLYHRDRLGKDVFLVTGPDAGTTLLPACLDRAHRALRRNAVSRRCACRGRRLRLENRGRSLGQFAIEAVELIETAGERGHDMPPRPLFLLAVDVVA